MDLAGGYDLDLGSQLGDLTKTDDLLIFRTFIRWLTYYRPCNFQVVRDLDICDLTSTQSAFTSSCPFQVMPRSKTHNNNYKLTKLKFLNHNLYGLDVNFVI